MFPNMRLFLGALLASIVALCGVFGVFAAFRVNHEPLSRLPADTVALQLIASETAGPPPAWHAPVSPRFEVRQSLSTVAIDGAINDAPQPLPISRVTIQPSSLRTVSAVGPAAAIDAAQEGMPSRLESPPLGMSAAAALSAPALSATLVADVNQQPAAAAQIGINAAPLTSPASTATAPVQQELIAEIKPAQSPPDAKPAVLGKAGEPPIAPAPVVAAAEASSDPIAPASQPADIASTAPTIAVPEPKARPAFIANAIQRALQKKARQALLRRRLAARRRMAAMMATDNFGNPFFQSAPGAFRDQPATNRSTVRNNANTADNSAARTWPTSQ